MNALPRLRFDRLDALRGLAMVWMALFHFCFDLSYLGYWPQDFRADPFWTQQRTAIVSLFLFCAGLGQAVALQQGQGWARFGRRWAQIAGGALLVSIGSWWMFPQSLIYFGVLHGMAVMLLLAHRPQWLQGAVPSLLKPLAALGRWSLSFYLLHQPVLLGALMAFGWALRQMLG